MGVVSGLTLASIGLISGPEMVLAIALVIFGGLFPDIDSDHSTSIRLIFNVIGAFTGILLACFFIEDYGVVPAVLLVAICFMLIRFVLIAPFRDFTVHRGMAHSSPMAVLTTLMVVVGCFYVLGMNSVEAWTTGSLFFIGYVSHLILDELYSVDLANQTIKRSFGTAIKLFDTRQPLQYLALFAAIVMCGYFTPPITEWLNILQLQQIKLFTPEFHLLLNQYLTRGK